MPAPWQERAAGPGAKPVPLTSSERLIWTLRSDGKVWFPTAGEQDDAYTAAYERHYAVDGDAEGAA